MSEKALLLVVFGSLGVGLLGGLLQKIVWDWFKSRKDDEDYLMEENRRKDCMERLKACEIGNAQLASGQAALKARMDADITHIKERLLAGDARMQNMNRSISSIDRNLTQLVAIVGERTKKETTLFQTRPVDFNY